jgi:ribosomal protein S6E (S10)
LKFVLNIYPKKDTKQNKFIYGGKIVNDADSNNFLKPKAFKRMSNNLENINTYSAFDFTVDSTLNGNVNKNEIQGYFNVQQLYSVNLTGGSDGKGTAAFMDQKTQTAYQQDLERKYTEEVADPEGNPGNMEAYLKLVEKAKLGYSALRTYEIRGDKSNWSTNAQNSYSRN